MSVGDGPSDSNQESPSSLVDEASFHENWVCPLSNRLKEAMIVQKTNSFNSSFTIN